MLYYIYTHKSFMNTGTDIPAAAAPRRAATLMVAARAADVSAKMRSTDVSAAAASLIKAASAPDVEASDLLRVCVHTRQIRHSAHTHACKEAVSRVGACSRRRVGLLAI